MRIPSRRSVQGRIWTSAKGDLATPAPRSRSSLTYDCRHRVAPSLPKWAYYVVAESPHQH